MLCAVMKKEEFWRAFPEITARDNIGYNSPMSPCSYGQHWIEGASDARTRKQGTRKMCCHGLGFFSGDDLEMK